MNSLADMKIKIVELEDQKKKLETEISKADKQYKFGLWAVLVGVFLIPLYGIGFIPVIVGGFMALVNIAKRAKCRDELENLESQIHKLNLSMA